MQKTTTFNQEKANEVENAVCEYFGCNTSDIATYSDTLFKKVVVYVLYRFFDYHQRSIGAAYQMTYLYVPTVADEIEFQMLVVKGFREKIVGILKSVGYEARMDERCGAIAS